MNTLIDILTYPVFGVLPALLQDKTTKENILFATDSYSACGEGCSERDQITVEKLRCFDSLELQPRVLKSLEAQKLRTRVKAEVMTPGWIICKMNEYCDEEWFGRPNVFTVLNGTEWEPTQGKIVFPEGKTWQDYVDLRKIEITCGEAPYIVTRYDVTTGEEIPVEKRVGFLDRKLRVVSENCGSEEEWLKWALRAFQSSYGYEWQGDNLLIARINLLHTYVDHMLYALHRTPTKKELKKIANVIVWNLWQMDAFTCTIPYAKPQREEEQLSLFDEPDPNEKPVCLIRDWRESGEGGKAHKFTDLQKKEW